MAHIAHEVCRAGACADLLLQASLVAGKTATAHKPVGAATLPNQGGRSLPFQQGAEKR